MRKGILFLVVHVAVLVLLFQLNAYAQPQGGGGKGDRDNNPPGPQGGPGTNWENPPGPQGGPGASPDQMDESLKQKAIVDEEWEKQADKNKDGIVDQVEIEQWKQWRSALSNENRHFEFRFGERWQLRDTNCWQIKTYPRLFLL